MSSAAPPTKAPSANPAFFPDPALDRLTAALLQLTREVWVLTESLQGFEVLRAWRGVVLAEELAELQFSPQKDAYLQAARVKFVRGVLTPLTVTDD
jgi:hypothetical protein